MPDESLIAIATATAGGIAAVFVLIGSWPWRAPSPTRAALGWIVGAAAGFYTGLWIFQIRPTGDLSDVAQRFLLIVAPATIGVEAIAALTRTKWVWIARFAVAVGVAPALLWGTTYLSDSGGPGTPIWSPAVAAGISLIIGMVTTLIWAGLLRLGERDTGRFMAVGLGILCAAAGMAVIYTGYISGLYFGFAAAAVVIAPAIASLLIRGPVHPGALGVALVSFVSLLVMGRFFQTLTNAQTALLAAAALAFLAADFVPGRLWVRGAIGLALLAVPAGVAVTQARQDALARMIPPERPQSPKSGTLQDYLDFGK